MSETGMTNTYIGQNYFLPKQLKNTQVYFFKTKSRYITFLSLTFLFKRTIA